MEGEEWTECRQEQREEAGGGSRYGSRDEESNPVSY